MRRVYSFSSIATIESGPSCSSEPLPRKLSAKVVIKYRNDWLARVSKQRENHPSEQKIAETPFSNANTKDEPKSAAQHLEDIKRRAELAQKRTIHQNRNSAMDLSKITQETISHLHMTDE
jgi:hypothetical protein